MTKARSGRDPETLSLDSVLTGSVTADDVRIHPDTLRRQADVAHAHANPHLAANLRRAAELTALPDERVLAIYEALRPGRSTFAELEEIAAELDVVPAPACSALVREAAAAYVRRGVIA